MVVRLKGEIVCEENCQLVIDLTEEDAELFNIKEGDKVMVEWKELQKWDNES